jgi:uncharacterized protein YfbU (UPF0304 family)
MSNLELRIAPAAMRFRVSFGRRTVVINITDVERRVLINQARILAALYPLEASQFERTIEILSEGYHEAWEDVILKGLKKPFLKEQMNFIYQTLEMFDWLQKSYYALNLDEKLRLPERSLIFPGFDPKEEPRHLYYCRFLIENLDRFAFVETSDSAVADQPMYEIYERMLNRLPRDGRDFLSAKSLEKVIVELPR